MKMDSEKRYSVRKPVVLNILVDDDLAHPRLWKTRNLSTDGVFVVCREERMSVASRVEAVVLLPNERGEGPLRLPARVARVARDGVGLKFDDYPSRIYIALDEFLNTI